MDTQHNTRLLVRLNHTYGKPLAFCEIASLLRCYGMKIINYTSTAYPTWHILTLNNITSTKHLASITEQSFSIKELFILYGEFTHQSLQRIQLPPDSTTIRLRYRHNTTQHNHIDAIASTLRALHPQLTYNMTSYDNYFLILGHTTTTYSLWQHIATNSESFKQRMPTKRPKTVHYTLKADLARLLINCASLKDKSIIIDPCCGYGGILFESAALKHHTLGIDIKEHNIHASSANALHFSLNILLLENNFFTTHLPSHFFDACITDLPYGLTTSVVGNNFHDSFFTCTAQCLKKKGKLIFISNQDLHSLDAFQQHFILHELHTLRVHSSFHRYIHIAQKI